MHIFVDESGSFSGVGEFPSPSLVGALIVPSSKWADIQRRYARIRQTLPTERGEVKGRLLNERDVARVVDILRRNEVLFEATMIDLGTHTAAGLESDKANRAESVTSGLTDQHHPNIREAAYKLRIELEKLSSPLYVQSTLNFDLIYRVIQHGMMYFCQRRPQELGAFHWVIDAKGKNSTPTAWEKWWSFVVMPTLQSRSLREPWSWLVGGDYTHFRRFEDSWAEYLLPHVPDSDRPQPPPINLRLLMTESFKFSNDADPGLELVDIVTNALRRALIGNLAEAGWVDVPRLMINRKRQYFSILALEESAQQPRNYPYSHILRAFSVNGRRMLTRRINRKDPSQVPNPS